MTDLLIKNALIIDGSGEKLFPGDVAIEGQMISETGDLSGLTSNETIDVKGRIIAPGFIDMHSHSDVLFANGSSIDHKIYQGVTTELIGQDGFSIIPVTENAMDHLAEFFDTVAGKLEKGWKPWDVNGFFAHMDKQKSQLNMATLIGNANLRLAVIGHKMGVASKDELDRMCALLDESLAQGAYGLALGLIYPPSSYSDTEELIEFGRIIRKHDGMMVAHMRNEQAGIIEAVEEMIRIGEESGCRIHISHLKCLGKPSWGKMTQVLELLEKAEEEGLGVSFDQYPYEASNTSLSALLPGWSLEGGHLGFKKSLEDAQKRKEIRKTIRETIESRGGSESIIIATVKSDRSRSLTGMSVRELSETWEMPVEEAVLKLLSEEELQVLAIYHAISEKDIELAMKHPLQTVGSDGVLGEFPHPRAFGSFPRVISRYSEKRELFPLEKAIQKMTSKPASLLRLDKRGWIKKGYFADLVVFEKGKFQDIATFDNPIQMAKGLDWVFVNGQQLLRDGKLTDKKPGLVLRSTF